MAVAWGVAVRRPGRGRRTVADWFETLSDGRAQLTFSVRVGHTQRVRSHPRSRRRYLGTRSSRFGVPAPGLVMASFVAPSVSASATCAGVAVLCSLR